MYRWLVFLAWLAFPAIAIAKPTLAVAPLDGDRDGEVAALVAEAAEDEAKVTTPDKVEGVLEKLGVSKGEIDGRVVKKLRKRLDVEVVVYGKVEKDDGKKTLELNVSARGKKTSRFSITFKNADSKAFKRELREELGKRLASDERDDSNNDDDDDDDRPTKKDREDDDDDRKRKKKRRDDNDDGDDDRPRPRHKVTQVAFRGLVGGGFSRRTLKYDSTAVPHPPNVGTFDPAVHLELEIYPFAFKSVKGPAAGIGFVAEFETSFGVSIDNVPGTDASAPIDQGRYSAGMRYRMIFGSATFAFGASYWHRHYFADRSALPVSSPLDMPDVSYEAVAPNAVVRFGVDKKIAAYFQLEVPLMFQTGQIQRNDSYGPASIIAFELEGGADFMFTPNYGVRIAAEFGQVGFSFAQKMGTQSEARMTPSATDRIIGAMAMLAITY